MKNNLRLGFIAVFINVVCCSTILAQKRDASTITYVEQSNNANVKTHQRIALKLNPLLLVRGDIPVYYEMSLSNRLSVELGVGLTAIDYLTSRNYNLDPDQDLDYKIELGFSVRGGLRYYTSDYSYEPHGFYFGVTYRLQNFKSELTKINNFDNLSENIEAVNNDARFEIGFVNTFEEGVFIEPYIGIGFRSRDYDKIIIDEFVYSINRTNDIVPYFSIGAKIGFSL